METEQEVSRVDDTLMRTAELAAKMKVAESTIRKYSMTLEKKGHTFIREPNNNMGRLFTKLDQELLKKMSELAAGRKVSLEYAASGALRLLEPEMQPSHQEAPRAPSVLGDESAKKLLESMQLHFREETDKMKEEIKGYFKEEMRDVIEDAVEKQLRRQLAEQEQRHKEDMKLLKDEFNRVSEAMERREKKNIFQRLFGVKRTLS